MAASLEREFLSLHAAAQQGGACSQGSAPGGSSDQRRIVPPELDPYRAQKAVASITETFGHELLEKNQGAYHESIAT